MTQRDADKVVPGSQLFTGAGDVVTVVSRVMYDENWTKVWRDWGRLDAAVGKVRAFWCRREDGSLTKIGIESVGTYGHLPPLTANVYADWLDENGEPMAAAKLRAAFPMDPVTAEKTAGAL